MNINIEETLVDFIDRNKKPKIVFYLIYSFYCYFNYTLPQFYKRMICRIKGCAVRGGRGGFNLPPEAYSRWCNRCGATESNYDYETEYKIIDKQRGGR